MPTAQVLTIAQMIAYARAAGFTGNDAIIAGAVGMAESSGNTHAINYVPCVGVWQINVRAHPQYTIEQMYDPAQNAKAARAVWQSQGWAAWTTYTSGAYKRYMPAAVKAAGSASGNITLGGVGGAVAGGAGGLVGAASGSNLSMINKAAASLMDPRMWLRILYVIVGIVMIMIGIAKLTATPQNIKLVKDAVEVVK